MGLDRSALEGSLPSNLIVATGGIVPPALQGHTPDIAPRFDPARARDLLGRSRFDGPVRILEAEERAAIAGVVAEMWRETLGLDVEVLVQPFAELARHPNLWDLAPVVVSGWLPGYPDPEYFLRLLLHSEIRTNEGGYSHPPFDELIERARRTRDGRARLELFHRADRMAVAEEAALIPLAYGRAMAFVKPWVEGWWEFGKTSTSFANLTVGEAPQGPDGRPDRPVCHSPGPWSIAPPLACGVSIPAGVGLCVRSRSRSSPTRPPCSPTASTVS